MFKNIIESILNLFHLYIRPDDNISHDADVERLYFKILKTPYAKYVDDIIYEIIDGQGVCRIYDEDDNLILDYDLFKPLVYYRG